MTYGIKFSDAEKKEQQETNRKNSRYPDPLNAIYTEVKDLIDNEVDPDIYWF